MYLQNTAYGDFEFKLLPGFIPKFKVILLVSSHIQSTHSETNTDATWTAHFQIQLG
jgi:hypothetical protein